MNEPVQILSTRPLAETIITEAAVKGIVIDTLSFIDTKSIVDRNVEQKILSVAASDATVVFTSMNGATAVIDVLKQHSLQPDWKIYCISTSTNNTINAYYTKATVAGSATNGLQLAQSIIDAGVKAVTFFCGNIRRDELPVALASNNIRVDEVVVYETIETSAPINKDYDAVLFFSPSAVRSFFAVNKLSPATVVFAIGATTATEVNAYTANPIVIGNHPSKEHLAEEAIKYFEERSVV